MNLEILKYIEKEIDRKEQEKTKYEYELKINDEDKLDIDIVLNDAKSKYNIDGNKNLKNNSINYTI